MKNTKTTTFNKHLSPPPLPRYLIPVANVDMKAFPLTSLLMLDRDRTDQMMILDAMKSK